MKYFIRKNWVETFEMMVKKPIVIFPFVLIAFFEAIALELSYFCTRPPISLVANPVIIKFFGDDFIHYPMSMTLIPKIFYYLQIAIYIFLGVFLTSIAINIFKNIRSTLPLKTNALVKNALGRYMSFFMYGVVTMLLVTLMQRSETFVFSKFVNLATRHITFLPQAVYNVLFLICLFISNIILQTFFVLTLPIIVLEKKPFLKAIFASVVVGAKNFLNLFALISLPFLAYMPIIALKDNPARLADKLFPEATALAVAAGIVVAIFADCFVVMCASRFLMDLEKR